MSNESHWNDLTQDEKLQKVKELQEFIERELGNRIDELKRLIEERPDDVRNFIFIHDRLPLAGEL